MSTDIDQLSHVEKLARLTQLYLELRLPLQDALRAAEADIEAALARAQANLGVIPAEAAAEITKQAKVEYIDFEKLRQQTERIGYPVLGVVPALSCKSWPILPLGSNAGTGSIRHRSLILFEFFITGHKTNNFNYSRPGR
jgi:hypothetical protein